MAANVEATLELGLREAAETIWARKVVLEAAGNPLALTPGGVELLVDAAAAHAKIVGRAEATAFALELLRGHGPLGEELLDAALRDIGGTTWERGRIPRIPGLHLERILDPARHFLGRSGRRRRAPLHPPALTNQPRKAPP